MKHEQDLSNVKKGDMIFSPTHGYSEVATNFGKTNEHPFGFIYMKDFCSCNHFGRQAHTSKHLPNEIHPRYFLNLGECVKYYSELYLLTLNKEEKND